MATSSASRFDLAIRPSYERLIDMGKEKKAALNSCMRTPNRCYFSEPMTMLNAVARDSKRWMDCA